MFQLVLTYKYLKKILKEKGGGGVNKNKLMAVLVAHGENQKILATALGISRTTLSKKISEKSEAVFFQPEISIIRKRYNLTDEDVIDFFAD